MGKQKRWRGMTYKWGNLIDDERSRTWRALLSSRQSVAGDEDTVRTIEVENFDFGAREDFE